MFDAETSSSALWDTPSNLSCQGQHVQSVQSVYSVQSVQSVPRTICTVRTVSAASHNKVCVPAGRPCLEGVETSECSKNRRQRQIVWGWRAADNCLQGTQLDQCGANQGYQKMNSIKVPSSDDATQLSISFR